MAYDPIKALEDVDFASLLGHGKKQRKSSSAALSSAQWRGALAPVAKAQTGSISAAEAMALKGDKGAKQAKATLDRILDSSAPDDLKEAAQQVFESGHGGGTDGGILHALTHNPLTDAVGKGLMAIDKPKRAVVATLDELGSALDPEYDNHSSWVDNVLRKPEYGFGDVVEEAAKQAKEHGHDNWLTDLESSKWGGRALGLIGDVGLDPLSYVGAGVIDDAAKGVRMSGEAVARKALRSGEDELAAKVLRAKGASALTAEELDKIGLRGGLRAGEHGPTIVPHDVSRQVGRGLSKVRETFLKSPKVRDLLSKVGSDERKAFREMLRNPEATDQELIDSLKGLDSQRTARLKGNEFGNRRSRELNDIIGQAKKAKVDGEVVGRALLGDADAATRVDAVLSGNPFRDWLNSVRDEVNGVAGEDVLKHKDDYLPGIPLKELRDKIDKRFSSAEARNAFGKSGHEIQSLQDGMEFLGRTLGDPDLVREAGSDITRDQVEHLMRQEFGTSKFYESNAYDILPRYLKAIQSRVEGLHTQAEWRARGVAKAIPEHLDEEGLTRALNRFDSKIEGPADEAWSRVEAAEGASTGARAEFDDAVDQLEKMLGESDDARYAARKADRNVRAAGRMGVDEDALRATLDELAADIASGSATAESKADLMRRLASTSREGAVNAERALPGLEGAVGDAQMDDLGDILAGGGRAASGREGPLRTSAQDARNAPGIAFSEPAGALGDAVPPTALPDAQSAIAEAEARVKRGLEVKSLKNVNLDESLQALENNYAHHKVNYSKLEKKLDAAEARGDAQRSMLASLDLERVDQEIKLNRQLKADIETLKSAPAEAAPLPKARVPYAEQIKKLSNTDLDDTIRARTQAVANEPGNLAAKDSLDLLKVERSRRTVEMVKKLGTVRAEPRTSLAPQVLPALEKTTAAEKKLAQGRELVAQHQAMFDQSSEAARIATADAGVVLDELKSRHAQVQHALTTASTRNASRNRYLQAALESRQRAIETAEALEGETDEHLRKILSLGVAADEAEAQLAETTTKAVDLEAARALATKPEAQDFMRREIPHGMRAFGNDFEMAPDWMMHAVDNVHQAWKDPGMFAKFIDSANRIFKTYAILSPGFHVRNSMGAFFNNFAAGVDVRSYGEFIKEFRRYNGGALETVVGRKLEKRGLESVSAKWRPIFEKFEEIGLFEDGNRWLTELSTTGGKITDNPLTRLSRRFGDRVEDFHRGTIMFDYLKKVGVDAPNAMDDAIERMYHMHFDYSDMSKIETDGIRRFIPFWTWTSRNIPLQFEMMLRNPRTYERFNIVKSDIGVAGDPMAPDYIGNSPTAIHLGDGQYLNPDLPFNSVDETMSRILSPAGIMQDAAPIFKVPIEMKFNKQFFADLPLDQERTALPEAWKWLEKPLRVLGTVKSDRHGDPIISGEDAYAVEQALPLLGRLRRLKPSEEKYQERHTASILSFLGVGTKQVTSKDRTNEMYRRNDELEKLQNLLADQKYDLKRTYQG